MSAEKGLGCRETSERLPWLLNGTLDADEARQVQAHVESCASCGAELAETRRMTAAFDAHVPSASLVALAWDQPLQGKDADQARRHVRLCPSCAEELTLARASRRLETGDSPASVARRQPVVLRFAGLAAGLVAAFAAGALWRSVGIPQASPAEPSRVATLQAEAKRAHSSESALREQLAKADAPQPNIPIVELFPTDRATRSAKPPENEVDVPKDALTLALMLNVDGSAARAASVEIRDEHGRVVWSGDGFKPGPLGAYTLGVATKLLADGRYTLAIHTGRSGPVATYSIRVRRTP